MNAISDPPSVRLTLPPELSGGNLHELYAHMGLLAQRGSRPDEWVVSDNTVRPRQSTQRLVWSEYLAGPGLKTERFDLMTAPNQDEFMQHLDPQLVASEMENIARVGGPHSLSAMLYSCQVEIISAADAVLADTVREWHHNFSNITFSDEPSKRMFPNASTHCISINPVLYRRAWLPAISMRVIHDPSFVEHLKAGNYSPAEGLTFGANHALAGSSFLYGNYLGPLLACHSPSVWSVVGARLLHSAVFSLGRTVPGRAPIPLDAIDLLPRRLDGFAHAEQVVPEGIGKTAYREAIDWWVMRLDQLFTFISDPASYQDSSGMYQPYRHQNWLINTAELFDRVTSALRSTRDPFASLLLTFSALDLVSEQFFGSDTGAISDPGAARKARDDVRGSMPELVAQVLIPGAERAVQALCSVADGFFLSSGIVEYTTKGNPVRRQPTEAVGPLLRARRNAVHGFGGAQAASKGTHELLAQHNGDLPSDLVFVPYLYLLKILCNLDVLKARIERGGSVIA